MAEMFNPKACAPDQWKVWLRDGGRLYLRAFSGWGLLWVFLYLFMGWAICRQTLVFIAVAGLSGAFQLFHLTVMERTARGHVGVRDLLASVVGLIREHPRLLIQTALVRMCVCLIITLLFVAAHMIFIFLHPHMGPNPDAKPVVIHGAWGQVMECAGAVFNVTIFPFLMQLGGSVSLVLPLLCEGLDVLSAKRLNTLAENRNQHNVSRLSWVFLLGAGLCIWLPLLIPFHVVYWMAVTQCFYADVFKGGYTIKALARSPIRLRPAVAFSSPH